MKLAEVVEKAKKLLDLKKLPLPEKPKVVELRIRPYEDHLGYDSLEIRVVLAEGTTRADRNVRNLDVIRDAIHDALLHAGIEEFPYIRMATQSELDEAGINF